MSYRQITPEERYVIAHLRLHGLSLREIGHRIGRSHTTIGRELKRNGPGVGAWWPYWHDVAQKRSDQRRYKARGYRRQDHGLLVDYVERKLRLDWSPEQIAAKLMLDHPGDSSMRVSAETIYRWVYLDARMGGALHRHLRRGRKHRRRQKRYGAGRRFIAGRKGFEMRPNDVEARRRFGDWEGDTMVGRRGKSRIVTHVERKSRYLVAGKLEDRTASAFAQETVALLCAVPESLRRTLTLDNGSEGARFDTIEQQTGIQVYFAAPYAAWQRGTNENTNGLLRQYFPKGTDFRRVTDRALNAAVDRLNHRPRKCLGYRSPHQVFTEAVSGALAN